MSNLIKSGKVIDLSVPVNVGVSYTFDSVKNSIVEKKAPIVKSQPVSIKKEEKQPEKPEGKIVQEPVKTVSQEEILNKYMDEAKKKVEQFFNSEMKRAYEEGIKQAEEESKNIIESAKNERDKILEDVMNLKDETVREYKEEIKNSEKELLSLSLDIAEKIINYEIDKSDKYVLGIVKDALDRVMNKKDVVVKLSTADYYTVLSNKKYLMSNVKGFGEVDVVLDESMEPGSLIVDTPLGVIDSSIQVRMDNIQKEVMKILNEE